MFPCTLSSASPPENQDISSFLSSNVSSYQTLLSASPSQLTQALTHYHQCQLKSRKQNAAICVLIHKAHPSFTTEWLPLLQNMQEIPSNLPGYAFFHDFGNFLKPEFGKCSALGSTKKPSMVFDGSANGAFATFLVDTGATHSFVDSSFASELGLARAKANAQIQLADGSTQHASTQTNLSIRIQNHKTTIPCYILDMQEQFDVILGDTWTEKVGAIINCEDKTISVKKQGARLTIYPNSDESHNESDSHVNTLFLNAAQLQRHLRQGARTFMVRVTDSGIQLEGQEHCSPDIQKLIQEYQDVFSPISDLPPLRDTGHTIPTEPNSKPPFRPMFRLSPKELAEVERQVAELLKLGLIEPSSSPYGAPVLFVGKKDGTLRMCIDYRALNKITIKNKYPLPRIDQLMDSLAGATVFTSLDLQSGYHQIRITPEDVAKTAFRTPFGHYQFKVLSFGLTNAPATFQAAMNNMLRPHLNKFVVVYIDDILIYSKDRSQHIKHVQQVLDLLREHKYHIKLKKCEFEKSEVKFLGHIIGAEGVKVDPAKVAVIRDWKQPTNVHGVRSFVGLATYFRKFIEKFSKMVMALTHLTKKDVPFIWSAACQKAFDDVKRALTNAPVLALPNFSLPFVVICDASKEGLGAVLMQQGKPLAYESRRLLPAEVNYTVTEQELLAVVHALKIWRCYLEGPKFTVVTDHNPLVHLPSQPHLSGRQVRWSDYLQRFDFDWVYRPGKTNLAADALSRNPPSDRSPFCAALLMVLTRKQKAQEAAQSVETQPHPKKPRRSHAAMDSSPGGPGASSGGEETPILGESPEPPTLQHTWLPEGTLDIYDEVRAGYEQDPWFQDEKHTARYIFKDGLWWTQADQIIVPDIPTLRRSIISEMHDPPIYGHPGVTKTTKLAQRLFYWPTMLRDVAAYIKFCPSCQVHKSSTQKTAGTLKPLQIPSVPWQVVTLDFIMSLPCTKRGHTAILVVVDKLTKMTHLIPTTVNVTGEETAKLYIDHVFKHHGVPEAIVSDRDPRFTSNFMTAFLKIINVKQRLSTAFHPQTDGQTERMNRTLEDMLRHYVGPIHDRWDEHLAMAEFAINNSYQESIKTTPFRLNYFRDPPTPLTLNRDDKVPAATKLTEDMQMSLQAAKKALIAAQQRQKHYADTKRRPLSFKLGDEVLLSSKNLKTLQPHCTPKLLPKWLGPFTIIGCCGRSPSSQNDDEEEQVLAYKLELPEYMKIHPVFHVSLLKPYHRDGRVQPPPMPVTVEGEEWFLVDTILDHKDERVEIKRATKHSPAKYKTQRFYYVKWLGYGEEDNTWEPEDNVRDLDVFKSYLAHRGISPLSK